MSNPNQIQAIGVIFILLPAFVAVCRYWARSLVKARLGADDWLIIPALIFNLLTGIALILCARDGGLGAHMMPPKDPNDETGKTFIFTEVYRQFGIWKYLVQIFGTVTVSCTKLSILFLYKRIFISKWFQTTVNAWIGIILAWAIAFTLVLIFQCTPVPVFWSNYEWLIAGSCIPHLLDFYLAITVSDFICDVIIVLLPIPVLWKLQLPIRTRLATVGIFFLGAIVCAAGAVRLAIFFATPLNSADVTFNEAGTLYWTYIESAVAIIGACLPTLKPLFRGSLGGNTTAKASNGQWKSTTSKNLTDTGSFSQLRGEDGHQPNGHMTTVVTGHGHGHTQSDDESDRDIPMNQMGVRENNIIKTNKSWSTTYHTA